MSYITENLLIQILRKDGSVIDSTHMAMVPPDPNIKDHKDTHGDGNIIGYGDGINSEYIPYGHLKTYTTDRLVILKNNAISKPRCKYKWFKCTLGSDPLLDKHPKGGLGTESSPWTNLQFAIDQARALRVLLSEKGKPCPYLIAIDVIGVRDVQYTFDKTVHNILRIPNDVIILMDNTSAGLLDVEFQLISEDGWFSDYTLDAPYLDCATPYDVKGDIVLYGSNAIYGGEFVNVHGIISDGKGDAIPIYAIGVKANVLSGVLQSLTPLEYDTDGMLQCNSVLPDTTLIGFRTFTCASNIEKCKFVGIPLINCATSVISDCNITSGEVQESTTIIAKAVTYSDINITHHVRIDAAGLNYCNVQAEVTSIKANSIADCTITATDTQIATVYGSEPEYAGYTMWHGDGNPVGTQCVITDSTLKICYNTDLIKDNTHPFIEAFTVWEDIKISNSSFIVDTSAIDLSESKNVIIDIYSKIDDGGINNSSTIIGDSTGWNEHWRFTSPDVED